MICISLLSQLRRHIWPISPIDKNAFPFIKKNCRVKFDHCIINIYNEWVFPVVKMMFAELKNPSRVVVTSWCVNNLIYEFLKARTMVSSSIVPLLKVTVSSMVSSWQLG